MKPCGFLSRLSASDPLRKNRWQVVLNKHPQICTGKHNFPKVMVKGEERAGLKCFFKLLIGGRRKARQYKCSRGERGRKNCILVPGIWYLSETAERDVVISANQDELAGQ